MDGLVITYSGSKAVKITEAMRKDLNNYNNRNFEIKTLVDSLNLKKASLEEKQTQLSELEDIANGDDKRAAKDASRQIKSLQKENDKQSKDIQDTQNKIDELTQKQNKAIIEGTILKDIMSLGQKEEIPSEEDANGESEIVEPKTQEEVSSIENEAENDDLTSELDDDLTSELDDEKNSNGISQEEMPKEFDESEFEPINTDLSNELEENKDPENEEIKPIALEKPEIPVVSNEIETPDIPENEIANSEIPVIEESPVEMTEKSEEQAEIPTVENHQEEPANEMEEDLISEEDANALWEGLQNVELNTLPEETEEQTIEEAVHNDISASLPNFEAINPVVTENTMNEVYEENEVMPEEELDETNRDLKNLTLFRDYADYTFAFGQKHFKREALTPSELESLKKLKSFPSEKMFYSRRATQYNKIANDSAKLKKKVITLGKDFTKKLNEVSAEYDKNVKELSKVAEAAKNQAEIDRVEKIQTSRLNDTLTQTVREHESNIEELTNINAGLQTTIDSQNNKISELEKLNAEQAEQIRMFEEKLNTVFGIVKEVKPN